MKSINRETGDWSNNKSGSTSSLFKVERDFFYGLVKSYIQSGGTDTEALKLYQDSLDSVERYQMFTTSKTGLFYVRNYDSLTKTHEDYTEYSGAYIGAMLSMGATSMEKQLTIQLKSRKGKPIKVIAADRNRIYRHRKLAQGLTDMFHLAANKTATGLPPWRVYFNDKNEATNSRPEFDSFHLG